MSIRSKRSSYKPLFVDCKLLEKILKITRENTKKFVKTYSRSSTIVPPMIGFNIAIYNGKKFVDLHITENMVGHKLGEFSSTRKSGGHTAKTTKTATPKKGKK